MYGAQTGMAQVKKFLLFENDVEMYGAQTALLARMGIQSFENDVEMYGAQTNEQPCCFRLYV